MGVLTCYRLGCDNVMCDVCVDGIGYICYECESEFKDYLEEKEIDTISEGQMKRELRMFMATIKGEFTEGEQTNVDDFFDSYRRDL